MSLLKTYRDVDPATSLRNLLLCLVTLSVKKIACYHVHLTFGNRSGLYRDRTSEWSVSVISSGFLDSR